MARVEHAGASIHWTSVGSGEPLLMLMGLGCSSAMWFRLAPLLAQRYRVVLMDNRGVGRTEVRHYVVHRVSTMAGDVAAVLDAAGEASAHVLGFSMGGMIAQEFALTFPQRLRSLILMATHCGGSTAVLPPSDVWRLLFDKGRMTPEQNLHVMRPHTYHPSTEQRLVDEDHAVRLDSWPEPRGYLAQLYGLMGWSSYSRLARVRSPTLVMHGRDDRLIPADNADILARAIPATRLVKLDDASHMIATDQLARTGAEINSFLREARR